MTGSVPLAHVTRDGFVESVHRGIAVVADATGEVLAAWGDPAQRIALRSAAKPFQAAWFVASGAAAALGVTDEELAVVVGSHGGAPEHVAAVRSLMGRGGVTEDRLGCGVHPPFDAGARLALRGAPASVLQNNCSGKHAAMIAGARWAGQDAAGYLEPGHPWQRGNLGLLAAAAGIVPAEVETVTDGCSAPSFILPVGAAATAYARLAAGEPPALARVFAASVAHPRMIAGDKRIETAAMELLPGALLAKGGAEGIMGLALRAQGGRALGAIVKIADGDTQRARGAVTIALLARFGGLGAADAAALHATFAPPVITLGGKRVGEIRALV